MTIADGSRILHELLLDYVWKGVIVLVGILVLALAMIVLWRKFSDPRR